MKKAASVLILFLINACTAFCQDVPVEMASAMRESGKIYVVVGVLLIIFAGIIFYLVMLDRKIGRLEKQSRRELESKA